MEIRVLRYVVALAEERHFGRAAARAHVAQSALSQQVKQLETELGVRLFERSTRHVAITEAGSRFLEHATGIVAAADRAAAEMHAVATGRAGAVAVGLVGTATYDVLPRVTRLVRAELPDVELTVRGELLNPELLDGVRSGRFDLVLVRPDGVDTDGLEVRHLRTERLVAALPSTHLLAGMPRLELAALAGETLVVHPSGDRSSMHRRVLAACRAAGFDPPALVEVGETSTLAVSVAAGLGVALVPEPVRSLRLDGVTYVGLADSSSDQLTVDLALATRRADRAPATAAVARIVRRATAPTAR